MTAAAPCNVRHLVPTHPAESWSNRGGHLGMILLSVDRASELELRRMLPSEIAEIHVNRIAMAPTCSVDTLKALAADLASAAADLLPGTPLDAIGFACTSGAVAIGRDAVRGAIGATHPGVPVTAPLEAAKQALAVLGVRRIAVLTPYSDDVNAMVADALHTEGVELTAFASYHLDTDRDMTALAPTSLREAALEIDSPRADALFICCTALRPSGILAELEARTGKPVISSHQAMLWHALALAGIDTPISGYGHLLALPERSHLLTS